MSSDDVNKGRRRFLVATTSVVGGVGIGFAAVPFIKSWMPSAKAQAVGAPVEVNISKLKEGQLLKVQWRGQTIGVLRRTAEMIANLPKELPAWTRWVPPYAIGSSSAFWFLDRLFTALG